MNELPALSPYRARQAQEIYQEAQEIMNPTEVQITELVIGYLQSWEFLALLGLIVAFRAVKRLL